MSLSKLPVTSSTCSGRMRRCRLLLPQLIRSATPKRKPRITQRQSWPTITNHEQGATRRALSAAGMCIYSLLPESSQHVKGFVRHHAAGSLLSRSWSGAGRGRAPRRRLPPRNSAGPAPLAAPHRFVGAAPGCAAAGCPPARNCAPSCRCTPTDLPASGQEVA